MARSKIEAHDLGLEELLDSVETGAAVLPAFQRDFKWSNADAVSLIATVLSGWPAGSLLLMNGAPEFFEVRGFEDGPSIVEDVQYVILDGQQRLTSLFRAFRGHEHSVFVLNATDLLSKPGTAEDIEECISVIQLPKWRREYPLARQADELLVPLFVLRSASDYFTWRDDVISAASPERRDLVSKQLAELYRDYLSRANKYMLPSVVLDKALPSAAVARIFERINRTGLRLGAFDLLVARSYSGAWNLRDHWESARTESEAIGSWLKQDGLPVVQLISLALSRDVRQPALLALEPDQISKNWDVAVPAMEKAIQTLRRFGVPSSDFMPYKGLIFPIASRYLKYPERSMEDDATLLRWFWGRSFGLGYDVGSSTRLAADSRVLLSAEPRWQMGEFVINKVLLRAATRKKQGAIWSAFVSYLSFRKPRDLLTNVELDTSSSDVVLASVLPRVSNADLHLRVFGLIWASRETAKALRADRESVLRRAHHEALRSQSLPMEMLSAALDPEILLASRVDSLQETLNELPGLDAFVWVGELEEDEEESEG